MTNDFNVIYFYIIIQSILILIVFVVSLLLYRLISMSNKVSRLAPFSVPVKSNALTTFEKIDILYIKIIKKISKVLKFSKFFTKRGEHYEKFIEKDELLKLEGIDIISKKIIFSISAGIITIISDAIRLKTVSSIQIILSLIFGYYIYDIFLNIKRRKEEKQIEDDMLKAVVIMNNAFKSGRSIMQAIDITSKELDGAIALEFKKMYIDLTYGLSLDVVFDRFSKRVNLEEVKYMAASLIILNKTGGNVVKIFDMIEKGFFDRKKLKDELNASIALSKLVYKVLIVLPIIVVLFIYILNPNYYDVFFNNVIGRIVLGIIIILYILYIYFVKKITIIKE